MLRRRTIDKGRRPHLAAFMSRAARRATLVSFSRIVRSRPGSPSGAIMAILSLSGFFLTSFAPSAPTFFVGDQMLWGQDRMDFVVEEKSALTECSAVEKPGDLPRSPRPLLRFPSYYALLPISLRYWDICRIASFGLRSSSYNSARL